MDYLTFLLDRHGDTSVVCMFVVLLDVASSQLVNAEVGNFEHEAIVDNTVGAFQSSVRFDVGIVQVGHALDTPYHTRTIFTYLLTDTARRVCGRVFVTVRCPSVCPTSIAAAACGGFAAVRRQAGDIDRLLHGASAACAPCSSRRIEPASFESLFQCLAFWHHHTIHCERVSECVDLYSA